MSQIKDDVQDQLRVVAQAIFDKKGFNILVLDVRGLSTLTDYFVVAEGRVDRHVRALSEEVVHQMKNCGRMPLHIEGKRTGDWVVIDFADIVVHLFGPDQREHYALEQLWHEGHIVDVPIQVREGVNRDWEDFQENHEQ